jgi:hypothetical protein
MSKKAGHFQIKLKGHFEDYGEQEDKILKRAFMAGFPNAKFELRGQKYVYDFKKMVQTNTDTGKEREIRPPHKWKAPSKPIVPAGPTMTITVPAGSPGTQIQVPHPKDKNKVFCVKVPAGAKVGQAMLVPVPDVSKCEAAGGAVADGPSVAGAPLGKTEKNSGWSTGAKVAAGIGGAAVVGGAAVLGTEIAEHGAETTFDAIGDGVGDAAAAVGEAAGDAGEAIGEFAGEAGDFLTEGFDEVGDFIMDLF